MVSLEEAAPWQLSYADEIDKKLDLQFLTQGLIEGLKGLTGTQQEVLILRFILGFTTLEIARSLNKQQGADPRPANARAQKTGPISCHPAGAGIRFVNWFGLKHAYFISPPPSGGYEHTPVAGCGWGVCIVR